MLKSARRVVDFFIGGAAFIAAAALLVVMGVIVVDVVGRFLGSPLPGALDIVKMAFVFVVFGGMGYCDRIGGHVAVDLFETKFPPRLNFYFSIFAALVGAVIFALIAWQIWEATKISIMLHSATNILKLPRAPFQYVMVGFAGLTSLSMALRAILMRFDETASGNVAGGGAS